MPDARTTVTRRRLQNDHSVAAEVEKNYRGAKPQVLGRFKVFLQGVEVVAVWNMASGMFVLREYC